MKKCLILLITLGMLAGTTLAQDLDFDDTTAQNVEETLEDVGQSVEETFENVGQTLEHVGEMLENIELTDARPKKLSRDDKLKERFGDKFSNRRDSVSVGSNQNIDRNSAAKDVTTVLGDTRLDGYAHDVVTVCGTITLGPEAIVDGDVVVVMGRLEIMDGAEVRGDAIGVAGGVSDPGDGVSGSVMSIGGPLLLVPFGIAAPTLAFVIMFTLVRALSTLLLAYIVIALMPKGIVRVGDQLVREPVVSGLLGAGTAFVGMPLLWLLLAITCIGIFLVPVVFAAATVVGYTAVILRVGHKVRTTVRGNSHRPYLDVTIGALVFLIMGFVPYIGLLVKVVLVCAGLGAVVLTNFGRKDGLRTEPVVAEPATVPNESV